MHRYYVLLRPFTPSSIAFVTPTPKTRNSYLEHVVCRLQGQRDGVTHVRHEIEVQCGQLVYVLARADFPDPSSGELICCKSSIELN